MNLLGIPRSKISYFNRLKQDLSIAEQLQLEGETNSILERISEYKRKQKQARKARKDKEA